MSNELIKNRSEILFLYDIKDANPNGDPNDENKPRMDEETNINIVTDVRLKRTIRDFLYENKGKEIFVREIQDEKGHIQDGKGRAKDFGKDKKEITDNVLAGCIDVRLFGSTIPLDKDSITFTGPVQFKMGRSLHPVEINYIKGTGAFASKEGASQKTFREEHFVFYSLIGFHGIINQNAAKYTLMTEDDKQMLLEGVWLGTQNLISRTKIGQMPRLLLVIDYNDANFFMGDLNEKIKMQADMAFEKIRSVREYQLDLSDLIKDIEKNKEKIAKINYKIDSNLSFIKGDAPVDFKNALTFNGITLEEIKF